MEILLEAQSPAAAQGFSDPEFDGTHRWRWARGSDQCVRFEAPLQSCRIYYRLIIPVEGTNVAIHVNGTPALAHTARDPGQDFEGHFDFLAIAGGQRIEFKVSRLDPAKVFPADPSLSYFVTRFLLVPLPKFPAQT